MERTLVLVVMAAICLLATGRLMPQQSFLESVEERSGEREWNEFEAELEQVAHPAGGREEVQDKRGDKFLEQVMSSLLGEEFSRTEASGGEERQLSESMFVDTKWSEQPANSVPGFVQRQAAESTGSSESTDSSEEGVHTILHLDSMVQRQDAESTDSTESTGSSEDGVRTILHLDNKLRGESSESSESSEDSSELHNNEVVRVKREKNAEDNRPINAESGCAVSVVATTQMSVLYSHEGYVEGLPYGEDLQCAFQVVAPPTYYVWFHFITFNIEPDSSCRYDSVQFFRDEIARDTAVTELLCGNNNPGIITVPSNNAFIYFKTDESEARAGFKLEYKAYNPNSSPQRGCMFGAEETCAFPCQCATSACDQASGACLSGGCVWEEARGDMVEDKWTGANCQTGNVARGKHAFTRFGDANAATDGRTGVFSMDHCVTVKADRSVDSVLTVDLGGLYQVDYIQVIGAPANTPEALTLRDFYVKQSPSRDKMSGGCNTYHGMVPGADNITCSVRSRFISLTRFSDPLHSNYDMTICELLVIGRKIYDVDCSRCEADRCEEDTLCTQCQVTYTEPSCDPIVDCGVPDAPEHGSVSYTGTNRPAVATFQCDTGFTLKGSPRAVCGFDLDVWDGSATCIRNCGPVPRIDHAVYPGVMSGLDGDYVEYVCEEGFQATGSSYLVCSEGQWANPVSYPQCEVPSCKILNLNDPYINLNFTNGTQESSVLVYNCDKGYFIRGQVDGFYTMTCQDNGEWDRPLPRCEAFCGQYIASREGTLSSKNYPNKYPAWENCTYVIQTTYPGDRLNVSFESFDVEDAVDCKFDSLNLYESNGFRQVDIGKFCGTRIPPSFITQGNFLIVNFYTDEAYQGKGFMMRYNTITAELPVDLSGLVARYYPALRTQTIGNMAVDKFAEAVTFLRSYMLTAAGKQMEGDCLFLLEAMDASYNLMSHHVLPHVAHYIVSSFTKAEIHAPKDASTLQMIQRLKDTKAIENIVSKIYGPFIELGHRALSLSGLRGMDADSYDAMQGLLFHALEQTLYDKTYVDPGMTAGELAVLLVVESHRRVMELLPTTLANVQCEPLSNTLGDLLVELQNTVNQVNGVLSDLPTMALSVFGGGTEEFVRLFVEELTQKYEVLDMPVAVMRELVAELPQVKLSEDISQSGTTPMPGVITEYELRVQFTGPRTWVLLHHGLERTVAITMQAQVQADVLKALLSVVPDARSQAVKELDLATLVRLVEAMVDRVRQQGYATCIDPKLASMFIGFMEVQLLDLALTDYNITALGEELAAVVMQDTELDLYTVVSNVITEFRSVLFEDFRRNFLVYERNILAAFSGDVPANTLPLDLLIALTAEPPQTSFDLMESLVDGSLMALTAPMTCVDSVYIPVVQATETFVNMFRVEGIVEDILANFNFLSRVSGRTVSVLRLRVEEHVRMIMSLVLDPYRVSWTMGSESQYLMYVREFVTRGLGQLLYDLIHRETDSTPVVLDEFLEILKQQADGMKAVLQQYMNGLREILRAVGADDVDICTVYPDACQFCWELTKKR